MTQDERRRLWAAIDAYIVECGGTPGEADCPQCDEHRKRAAEEIERVTQQIEERAKDDLAAAVLT